MTRYTTHLQVSYSSFPTVEGFRQIICLFGMGARTVKKPFVEFSHAHYNAMVYFGSRAETARINADKNISLFPFVFF